MSDPQFTAATFDPREPIGGYYTRELIGRGGFGEVWKAEAPGGLSKAIKIVHAGIDSHRAERELRALQRIKDVRHPLILSIERIEIVAGTLVIVTELADRSLRDLFRKSREQGLPGIPREKLISLLRDAADALDYIYEEHSLQHLDIKPENLLVVGNRLKLGDFGLLKNIYERGASLVSGLTPTYAPPELFEGKPTRQSDQYSLAIVYQHMLTGELPFEGATAAQLAREHLAGVPRLTLLSRAERPVIARALSKVPGERFANCSELISSLAAAPPDAAEPQGPVEAATETPAQPSVVLRTQTVSVEIPGRTGRDAGPESRDAAGSEDASCDAAPDAVLGALEASLRPTTRAADSSTRRSGVMPGAGFVPTLFIGVGATGGLVIQELRRRLSDAFGGLERVPALQLMLLDTDGRQINSLIRDRDAWADVDVVALPLRRPEDYKFRESGLNKWLHRRWLYNMPRSLATEGYRPLGRLALVDHGQRVLLALRTALARAAAGDHVARTAASTGLPFRTGHVRVVLAASASGATGSGMVLDLAYAVRGELKRRGCSDEDVLAFLLHSAPHAASERDKAIANAYATLTELGHYSSPGRYYPGERALETPSFHGDNRTFSAPYLVSLGTGIDAPSWYTAAARIAEYLYCTTATPAKLVFDATRHADEGLSPTNPSAVLLRSLDVRRLDPSDSEWVAEFLEQACRDVVALWTAGRSIQQTPTAERVRADQAAAVPAGEPSSATDDGPAAILAARWIAEQGLCLEELRSRALELARPLWGGPEPPGLRRLLAESGVVDAQRTVSRSNAFEACEGLIDSLLDDRDATTAATRAESRPIRWLAELRDGLKAQAAEVGRTLADRVRGLIDDPGAGAGAALTAAEALSKQLKRVRGELEQSHRAARDLRVVRTQAPTHVGTARRTHWLGLIPRRCTAEAASDLLDELAAHAGRRLEEARLNALMKFVEQVEGPIAVLAEQLKILIRDLGCLASEFPSLASLEEAGDGRGGDDSAARTYVQGVQQALQSGREVIARAVVEECHRTILVGDQKLQRFLGVSGQLREELAGPLRAVARRVVLSHIRQATQRYIEGSATTDDVTESACARLVSEFLQGPDATPVSPRERLVVVVPETVDPRQLQDAFAACTTATLVCGRTNGITLCREQTPRPLEDVAEEIVQNQELYRQLAEKLRTREDVDWAPLGPAGSELRLSRGAEAVVQAAGNVRDGV